MVRKKDIKEREKERERKLFHTGMQSKIKIPNKPQNNQKTENQTETSPKPLTPNTWRVKRDRRRGRERSK